MAYQKESNTLYALAGGVLSYWNGSTWNPLNAAAHTFLARSFAVLNDGYVIVGNDEMQYLPFEKETDDISLKIRGNIAINNIDAVSYTHLFQVPQDEPTAEEMAEEEKQKQRRAKNREKVARCMERKKLKDAQEKEDAAHENDSAV